MADALKQAISERRSPLSNLAESDAEDLLSAPQPAAIALLDSPNAEASPPAPQSAAALPAGFGEWLVVSENDSPAALVAQLTKQHERAAVTDISHGRFRIRVNGPQDRDVLQSGVALDLQESAFPVGHSTPTTFRDVAVLLHAADAQTFDLYVFRSYAQSLWMWLVDASKSGCV